MASKLGRALCYLTCIFSVITFAIGLKEPSFTFVAIWTMLLAIWMQLDLALDK